MFGDDVSAQGADLSQSPTLIKGTQAGMILLQGDTLKAGKSYQEFFSLWKVVDADLPILIEAKKENERLK